MSHGLGSVQQKVLLLLAAGLALGLSASPRRHFRILEALGKEWREIDRRLLRQAIRSLYRSKLIRARYHPDNSVTLELADEGQHRILTYKLGELTIPKPRHWDRKWRIITFDIPEQRKNVRDALRFHFRRIGLKELQKSVFIYPYPCDNEVDFLIEFYEIRPYVRKILAESLDNELHLRQMFDLGIRG